MDKPLAVDATTLQAMLASELFSPWVRELDLRVDELRGDELRLALPVAAKHVHGGGVLCGHTMMAAADTAMVLVATAALGGFRPMTTVHLQTSFIRPIAGDAGEARVTARVLRKGKNLLFGEIEVADAQGRLAAHATTTYALL